MDQSEIELITQSTWDGSLTAFVIINIYYMALSFFTMNILRGCVTEEDCFVEKENDLALPFRELINISVSTMVCYH